MTVKQLAHQIEEIAQSIKVISSFGEVFFHAFFRSDSTPEGYEWAFAYFCKMSKDVAEDMRELEETAFSLLAEKQPLECE